MRDVGRLPERLRKDRRRTFAGVYIHRWMTKGSGFQRQSASERLRYLVSTVAAARILRVSWKLTGHVSDLTGIGLPKKFCPGTILRQRGGCLRLFATSWQKRTPREPKLRTLCESAKPHGGQKMSAYLMRSYNLLDADGAEGTSFDSAELRPQYGSNAPAG